MFMIIRESSASGGGGGAAAGAAAAAMSGSQERTAKQVGQSQEPILQHFIRLLVSVWRRGNISPRYSPDVRESVGHVSNTTERTDQEESDVSAV